MAEKIHKLQPDRTITLRGFNDLGASAAMHSATPTSFVVSGGFRDAADFAVLTLWDVDNFYEHPRLKYLPDSNFAGVKLSFDFRYSGLMPLDSPKFATIDWPSLNVLPMNQAKPTAIRLIDHAMRIGGQHTRAKATFQVTGTGPRQYDRLTLFYEDIAFDCVVPEKQFAFVCARKGVGAQHTVKIAGTPYTYTERTGDTDATIAAGVVQALRACEKVIAEREPMYPPQINLTAALDDGVGFDVNVFGTPAPHLLFGWGFNTVAADLAGKINSRDYEGKLVPLRATTNGAVITITADIPGEHGNLLSMFALAKNDGLRTTEATAAFTGGTSDATWRVQLDFSTLGLTDVRRMWLTFAPALANAGPYVDSEWEAQFTNWTVTSANGTHWLQVAGPDSVRIEDTDSWCKYTGKWEVINGFYSGGFAHEATQAGLSVQVKYACSIAHDLYLGTTVNHRGGPVSVTLDTAAVPQVSTFLPYAPDEPPPEPVNTRLLLRKNVAPGEHVVTITPSALPFAFDFIEAAVPSDIPPALPAQTAVSPALDYSTDHTYKLPPARVHWIFDQLGFAAPMNEYIGVFWWNQRKRSGAVMPQWSITFSGVFVDGDEIQIRLEKEQADDSHFKFRKVVYPADTPDTIAAQLAQYISGYSVGVWAKAEGATLTIVSRSAGSAYRFPAGVRIIKAAGSTGAYSLTGSLETGAAGTWVIDPQQTPALNRGARDWHADMFRECAKRNREITVAMSMELVNPPAGFAAKFYDGTAVTTDVGFGKLHSTHCNFGSLMRSYQKAAFSCVAGLMSDAGITPSLQFGEFLWWFFNWYEPVKGQKVQAGMAFYDDETRQAAEKALGHQLCRFMTPDDDPAGNNADAVFVRNRLRDHVTELGNFLRSQHPGTRIELLFAYDVNHPKPAGIHSLGGKLNRFVNLPVEWESKATSGLDRIKTEALDFGAWNRNLDLARTAWELPIGLGWPRDSLRHLVPIFQPGYAWDKEVAMARGAGIPVVNLWAWDHICLHNAALPEPSKGRSSMIGG